MGCSVRRVPLLVKLDGTRSQVLRDRRTEDPGEQPVVAQCELVTKLLDKCIAEVLARARHDEVVDIDNKEDHLARLGVAPQAWVDRALDCAKGEEEVPELLFPDGTPLLQAVHRLDQTKCLFGLPACLLEVASVLVIPRVAVLGEFPAPGEAQVELNTWFDVPVEVGSLDVEACESEVHRGGD